MVDPRGMPQSQLPAPGTSSLGAGAKEEKAVKETRKMFKQIGRVASKIKGVPGAIGAIGAGIESVMPFLETLAPLFQAFEPIITITNAMFTAFAGALTAELMPALQPLFIAMIGMIPIFSELGAIVGQLVVVFLVPLVSVFTVIIPLISAFLLELLQTEGFMVLIAVTLGVLTGSIGPLLIIIGTVSTLIVGFVLIFTGIYTVINDVVMPAIGAFIMGIAVMIDAITFGMAGAVAFVNDLMGTLITSEPSESFTPYLPYDPGPSGGVQEGDITPSEEIETSGIQELQTGADSITRSGMFRLDVGEAVTPAGQVGLQTSLLEEIRDLQREQLLEAKWRMR